MLDTNVLVSGLISIDSPPARIVNAVRAGRLRLVVDERILVEYVEVLRRPALQPYLGDTDIEAVLDFLQQDSETVVCSRAIPGLPDAADAPFIETALEAGVPLVTGNARHFPASLRYGCRVHTPTEFVRGPLFCPAAS